MGVLFANPLRSPELLNTITVTSLTLGPFGDIKGKFELQDPEGRPFKWDLKDAPGTQGATITYRGSRPSKFKCYFAFWEDVQIDAFDQQMLPLFQIDSLKKTPVPVAVLQVLLASLDIFSLVPEKIGTYNDEGKGLISITIDCLEYAPAKKKNVTTTPTTTTTNKSKAASPTFQDAQDKEIASLLAKAASL